MNQLAIHMCERGFFANDPLCFIEINSQSIEHGLWLFLNEPLDFK
jgi:hypothetical protein